MDQTSQRIDQREDVLRIFYEMGWEDVDRIEEWDGSDIDQLRDVLDEDEFQTLLSELADADDV